METLLRNVWTEYHNQNKGWYDEDWNLTQSVYGELLCMVESGHLRNYSLNWSAWLDDAFEIQFFFLRASFLHVIKDTDSM